MGYLRISLKVAVLQCFRHCAAGILNIMRRTQTPAWAVDLAWNMAWAIAETKHQLKEIIMSESQDVVDAVTAQLGKASAEIVAEIAALEAQVAEGVAPDFTALKAAAQSLDDIVPDAPAEEPADTE